MDHVQYYAEVRNTFNRMCGRIADPASHFEFQYRRADKSYTYSNPICDPGGFTHFELRCGRNAAGDVINFQTWDDRRS